MSASLKEYQEWGDFFLYFAFIISYTQEEEKLDFKKIISTWAHKHCMLKMSSFVALLRWYKRYYSHRILRKGIIIIISNIGIL